MSGTHRFAHTRSHGSNICPARTWTFRVTIAKKDVTGIIAAVAPLRGLRPMKGIIVNKILVGNLNPNVTELDIRSIFEKHGTVRRSKMMTDRWTGLSRGFGFIEMKTDAQAEEAVVALNGTDLYGKVLKVNQARPQLHRRNRNPGICT